MRFVDREKGELVRSKYDILVYHTGKGKIEVPIKQIFGFRGAI